MSSSSPYRADHVGSFLRPAELLEARRSALALEQLHRLEDKHILPRAGEAEGSRP